MVKDKKRELEGFSQELCNAEVALVFRPSRNWELATPSTQYLRFVFKSVARICIQHQFSSGMSSLRPVRLIAARALFTICDAFSWASSYCFFGSSAGINRSGNTMLRKTSGFLLQPSMAPLSNRN